MAVYAIGDIQGCFHALERLLERIEFDPCADRLWFTGDLVNRGPDSLQVLRFVRDLGASARVVLGNHDLHLLAVWAGDGRLKRGDSLAAVLEAPDADELLHWLRERPLLHEEPGMPFTLVHAGISPQWDLATARRCARELEHTLRGPEFADFFRNIYGDEPDRWDERLEGWDRLRYITNVFTRMRYCAGDGGLRLSFKGPIDEAPPDHYPWFRVPGHHGLERGNTVICGHWSTLGLHTGDGILGIDTGCLWGGELTAVRLDRNREVICEPCQTVMEPGPGR